jgi:hypothetical protein
MIAVLSIITFALSLWLVHVSMDSLLSIAVRSIVIPIGMLCMFGSCVAFFLSILNLII